jgi:hypothetical protein
MSRIFLLLLITATGILDAQLAEPTISGPVLGYVFDSSAQSLRPILGMPGAATLGEPLDLGSPLVSAAISPRQDYFLAVSQEDQGLLLGGLDSNPPPLIPIPEARQGTEQIAISPSGSRAALYHGSAQRIQVIAGLPFQPTVAKDLDLSALPGTLTALAVSDAGGVLVSLSVAGAGSLFFFDPQGEARYVLGVGHVSSLAFLSNRDEAVVADQTANSVALIRNLTGAVEWIPLAAEKDGISAPVAVEVSGDSRRAFVASSGSPDVLILDLSGGVLGRLSCPCAVSGLQRLKGNSRFRLTPTTETPLWVFDGDTEQPRVVFIPRLSNVQDLVAPERRK